MHKLKAECGSTAVQTVYVQQLPHSLKKSKLRQWNIELEIYIKEFKSHVSAFTYVFYYAFVN